MIHTKIICIKCGSEFGAGNKKCLNCGSTYYNSYKHYVEMNNNRLIKIHPAKRLKIGQIAFCPFCNEFDCVQSENASKHIGCNCADGELFTVPISDDILVKFGSEYICRAKDICRVAFQLYPDDRKPESEYSVNEFNRNKYISDNIKNIKTKQDTFLMSKVSCPYCSSSNTSKIGFLSRSLSIGLFGLSSSKIGKQWHCNNCSSNF